MNKMILVAEMRDDKVPMEIPFLKDLIYHVAVINASDFEDRRLNWVHEKAKDLVDGWNKYNNEANQMDILIHEHRSEKYDSFEIYYDWEGDKEASLLTIREIGE